MIAFWVEGGSITGAVVYLSDCPTSTDRILTRLHYDSLKERELANWVPRAVYD